MTWLLRLLTGAGGLGDQLRRAYEAKLDAQNDADKLDAERDIERISAAIQMAQISASDRWGATSIGRYFIVVPFGIWWTAIWMVQILNPWLGLSLIVIDVPPHVYDLARVLIPAIVIADAGALTARRFLAK